MEGDEAAFVHPPLEVRDVSGYCGAVVQVVDDEQADRVLPTDLVSVADDRLNDPVQASRGDGVHKELQ